MASDLVLRFRGDEGNRNAFFGSIAKGPDEFVQAVNAANAQLLRARTNIARAPNRAGVFLDVRTLKTELDAANNVVKTLNQIGYVQQILYNRGNLLKGRFVPLAEFKEVSGNVDDLTKAITQLSAAEARYETVQKRVLAGNEAINRRIVERTQYVRTPRYAAALSNLDILRDARTAINDQLLERGTVLGGRDGRRPPTGAARQNIESQILRLQQQLLTVENQITAAVRERDNARRAEQRGIARGLAQQQADVAALEARRTRLATAMAAAEARRIGASGAFERAITGTPTSLPQNYQILPRNLLTILERGGLQPKPGQTLPDYLQRQTFNAPRYDLVRDVTRYSGSFENSKGIIADWSAEVDRSGKVVTRFGGQLSGASQVLKQITRDFQKVIEWTVATTIVFGALQYSIAQLQNLQELDYALTKFAITAQQSPAQAGESFKQLASIAFSTATPLLEIVGAADDIALATQRAGQSSEEWQRQIFSLTESVGVFTNLTGTDTVQATDLLTATMKQLRLTATDIPAILSKITAVAGGQSQAISDITKGLSAMAEAGRVANLTVDQQIATVQVLSQVTSKTPAEVATAFKNLVGSLGSPAALKGLEQFNIGVRTQQGDLRNILDIYGEISDKIKSGIIPTADVQGLIRAISGGPRRSPDAAALLAAIDQISTAEQRSARATNEAAIANARAIDTTRAKLIQLQSTIDAVTFEKFGGEFKTLIETLTTLLTTVLQAFNKIPTGVISAVIQIGLFFVAVRAGTKFLSFLTNYLRETAAAFLQVGTASQTAAGQLTLFNNASNANRTTTALRGNLGRLAAGTAIGAGLTAAAGGSGLQILGGGVQALGIGLLALPDPTFITKAAGAIALLGGTVLQFFTDTGKADINEADKALQIIDSFSKFRASSFDADALDRSQSQLADQIERLSKVENKSAEDISLLDSAQREYAKGLLDSINATKQMTESRQELIDVLSTSGDKDEQELAAQLQLASRYGVTGKALDDLILKYQKIILLRANPDLVFPDLESIPSFNFNAPIAPETGSTEARFTYGIGGRGGVSQTTSFDLTRLESEAQLVKRLFNQTGTEITASFEVTGQNIQLISNALNTLAEGGDPAAQALRQTFSAFVAQNDIISQTANNLAVYQAYLDGLSLIDPEKAAELERVKTLVTGFLETLPTRDPNISGPFEGPDVRAEALAFLEQTLKTRQVDYVELKRLAEEYFNTIPESERKFTTPLAFMAELFERLGFSLTQLGIEGPKALDSVSDAALDASEALDKSLGSLQENISGRLAQLQADLQAGEIKPAQFDKASASLRAYLSLVETIGPKFSESISSVAGFNETLSLLQGQFSSITGLENAASLSTEEFVERLLTLADTYGLNGQQLDILAVKLSNFHRLVEELNKISVSIPIKVALDLTSVRAALRQLRLALANSTGGPSSVGNPLVQAQLQGLLDLERVLSSIETTRTNITNVYRNGSGTPIGTIPSGSSSTKAGFDVSELDIPEEILKSPQMQALISQAIKNARNLQSQIPGATKEARNDLVVLLDGLTKVMQVQGVKSEYLRKALEQLAEIERKRLEFETKADTIRRIRVGAGDFSAIANVPVNTTTGVSLGGAEGPINITLNLNGTVLTPAQLSQFADLVAAALKRQISGG